jgi:hypothetical protein
MVFSAGESASSEGADKSENWLKGVGGNEEGFGKM